MRNYIRTSAFRAEIAAWLARRRAAFEILDPQVEVIKRSTTVKVLTGTAFAGFVISGNWSLAVGLAGCWIGSRPLVHVAAGGVASVGTLDTALQAAIARLQASTLNAKGDERPAGQ